MTAVRSRLPLAVSAPSLGACGPGRSGPRRLLPARYDEQGMSGQLSEGTVVGVVGGHPAVADAVEAAGGEPVVGEAAEVVSSELAVEVVVAVGEDALVDLVRAGVDAPVLPIAAGASVRSVPGIALGPAVERVVEGDWETVAYPLLVARTPLGPVRALFDITLVTDEVARISEYTVLGGSGRVSTFRADAVSVATPAGSTGYSRSADGPVLSPRTDAVAVVPVAPFAIDSDHWVLPAEDLRLRVERDETPVELLADGRASGVVIPGEELPVERDGSLSVVVVEESRSFYG